MPKVRDMLIAERPLSQLIDVFDLAVFRQFLSSSLIEKADYTGRSRYAHRRTPALTLINAFELATPQQFLLPDLIEKSDYICFSRFARS